jgi:hypothetical protein
VIGKKAHNNNDQHFVVALLASSFVNFGALKYTLYYFGGR